MWKYRTIQIEAPQWVLTLMGIFLLISLALACTLLAYANNDAVFQSTAIFISALTSFALVYIGYEANEVAKSNRETNRIKLTQHEREIFKENYNKLSKAMRLIQIEGCVEREAISLIWQTLDEAKLELPNDITSYVESIRAKAQKAWAHHNFIFTTNGDPKNIHSPNRDKAIEEESQLVLELYKETPYKTYRKYLKI